MDTDVGLIRGTQLGYNICNSTTENQNSLCQTSFFNGPDGGYCFFIQRLLVDLFLPFCSDFCLWAPSVPNKTVGAAEGEMVAWCSKPGHGTRLIPAGALTGIQFLKTPDYIQLVGFVDQTLLDIAPGDFGGEMDPHGADLVRHFCLFLTWLLFIYIYLARKSYGRYYVLYQLYGCC